jgi:hypothetical protein
MSRYGEGPGVPPRANAVENRASAAMSHAKNSNSRQSGPGAIYDPLTSQRPCARCGRRDAWRQIHGAGGGWLCCPSRELLSAWHAEAHHQCSRLCTIGGVA